MGLRAEILGFFVIASAFQLTEATARAESLLFRDNFTGNGIGELYVGPTGSPSINPFTTWSSTSNGRISLGPGLSMDTSQSGTFNLNEVNITLDLTGYEDFRATVMHRSNNDEVQDFGTSNGQYDPYTNHNNADGISVSVDGEKFVPLWSPSVTERKNLWYGVHIGNVDDALQRALAISTSGSLSTVTFRLQQYDNYSYPTDGREWESFSIFGVQSNGPGTAPSVPEPSSIVLLGLGSLGLLGANRRQKKQKAKQA